MSHPTVAGFRLSIQQERMWSQQAGAKTPFWAECELAVGGPLDPEKLRATLRAVVERNEILRTAFHRQTGVKVPFQVILDAPNFVWEFIDVSGVDISTQRSRLSNLVNHREDVVDLEKGPTLHVVLAKTGTDRYSLVLSLPALTSDLQSLRNLRATIAVGYALGIDVADEVLQYPDAAQWQHELLASEESKPARDYWRLHGRKIDVGALRTVLDAFELKPVRDFAPAEIEKQIEAKALGSPAGTALPRFLLAAWFAFLSRMTGRTTLTIGCHFDGRNYDELSSAIGAFARNLPLTAECLEGEAFGGLQAQVEREVSDFRNWQDSFTWGSPEHSVGEEHGPILPLAFEYAVQPDPIVGGGLTFTTVREQVCSERFALKLAVRCLGERLALSFQYDSGRIDATMVERWSSHFITLLQSAAAAPTTLVSHLPLLNQADREKLLVEWNHTSADYPREHCIHDLFETQAARTPNAPAVRFEDDCLSYRELNERANRLARYLRTIGVGSGSLVALSLDRSTNMMVAVLGILKAGGAYVPLSADHPKPRLAQQLNGTVALLTESKFECLMPEFGGATIVLDRDQERWAQQAADNPRPIADPESLAYVIYTSGSTGTPKGVAVRHRNLVNYTTFIQRRLELETYAEPLHFATVSTLGADLGNTCIYPALVSGGCLHVIGTDVAADSLRLSEYMANYPVDVLKIVPSHLMALLNAGGGSEVLPRKHLILGGEAFTTAMLEKISAVGSACRVFNHYGPTEATVGSLMLRVLDFDPKKSVARTVPIGRPIANTRLYVLDSGGEPVPIGVAGELYIAGDGVAEGYVGQPEPTAERFPAERLGPNPSATMYRTGDLVRYLPDGNVEFLGRADDQLKIRGFRIELGEVEAVLLKHAGVSQAVVLALADERGEKSLVAYFVGTASSDDLRGYLRTQLPDYMVPPAILELPRLPLNANGKIDRQVLPNPAEMKSVTKEVLAPRTPSEEVVAAIWAEVLKREDVGVEHNFFEIGGHSLLATQIASRLREHFHTPVPVRALFECPTISSLAKRMDAVRREAEGMIPPPIVPVSRNGGFALSFAQERLWLLDQIEPNNPLYNIPRALRLRGALRTDALERAINEIVRRHESQRTTFAVRDGHPVQVTLKTLNIPLEQHDLTSLLEDARESEARRLACAEAARPFNLARAPLVRAQLLRLDSEDHVLQLTMHHIISDAWSAGLFLQELTILYEAFCSGKQSPLPEPKVQYADYAVQERAWMQGEVIEKQLSFWRNRLKGIPPVVALPLDRERPHTRTFAGSCEMLHIVPERLAAMRELARREGATLFMALMAVFQTMLAKYSGEDQIVVGTDLANRMMPETESMLGFFINLMAVRSDLSGNPSFRELLSRVREGLLESYAHQDVPFPKIVQELQPDRRATHNPLVQVLFVMQNTPRARRELAGLQVEPFEVPVTTSKFDMAVFVSERPEGLNGYWVYSTEIFERATILRMLSHFSNLVDSVLAQPDARLSALTMLSAQELAQQEADIMQRKQSQFKKLKATTPSEVRLAGDIGDS